MKAIIVDNEKMATSSLSHLLSKNHPEIEILAVSHRFDDAIEVINNHSFDLLFLDIMLQSNLTGFDVLDKVTNLDFDVIFATAHSQFSLKAFKYSALDYLLKPISQTELSRSLSQIQRKYSIDKAQLLKQKLELLESNLKYSGDKKIMIHSTYEIHIVNEKDIIRVEGSGSYCNIVCTDETIVFSKHLKELESILQSSFFIRAHRSHIVNINYVKKIRKSGKSTLLMEDGAEIEITKQKRDILFQIISQE